ncbi:MAG: histidine phosphatase family protein [Cyclobacteriaceae bacterium]
MKTLFLVRHAKSSWSFNLPDHDRPLGKRGRKDVAKIGKYLAEIHDTPEVYISSTASRAFYTALFICDQLGVDEGNIVLSKDLFHAGSNEILHVIQSAPSCDRLAVFGHNPGFTDCANKLANTHIDNVPTCGVVGISFDVSSWKEVDFGNGKQAFFYTPKGI